MVFSRATFAAAAALTLGVTGHTPQMEREMPVSAAHIILAADDTAPQGAPTEENSTESAKMGKEEGTSKIDQPARRNPTTGTPDTSESGQ